MAESTPSAGADLGSAGKGTADPAALGERLQELKLRRGRSYEALALRTGLSRSTVHRYCQGKTTPDSFAVIEKLAKACDATNSELHELYNLWSRVSLGEQPAAPVETGSKAAEQSPDPTVAVAIPHRSRRTVRRLLIAGVVLALIAVPWLVKGRTHPDNRPQAAPGPAWVQTPQPVLPEYFGVTLNSSTGAMPGFDVGATRLWDSGTLWSLVEPTRGRYDWRTLDRMVNGAEKAHLPVLYTFGGTPGWASPHGPRSPYPDGSRASPPIDLRDWDTFVQALTTKYRGRIEAYELWVLAPSPHFFTGSPAVLAEMTQRAARILARTDPEATVVCPGMGELWDAASREYLRQFALAGGYDDCDVAGVKLQPKDFSRSPESIVELTTLIDRTFHEAGVHPPVWSTGTSYRVATAARLDETKARNYAVRLYLVGLYARYGRSYFYNWGGQKLPIVLQAEGGPPTAAALAVQELQSWLRGASIYSCGQGAAIGLPAGIWECRFRPPNGSGIGREAIRWTESGHVSTVVEADARAVRRLDGTRSAVHPGERFTVTEAPVMMEYS